MQFDIPAFVRSLRFLAEGWLGVFLVMAVIIAAVRLLNRLTRGRDEKAYRPLNSEKPALGRSAPENLKKRHRKKEENRARNANFSANDDFCGGEDFPHETL